MEDKKQKQPYTLLDGVIRLDEEGKLFNRLLGLVTSNLTRPLDSCRPEAPWSSRDQFEDPIHLYPSTAVECTNASWLVEKSVDQRAKAELSKLLTMWGDHQTEQGNDYSTTLLRRVEINENPTKKVSHLLTKKEYIDGIHDLMLHQRVKRGDTRKLAVIAGFLTCSDLAFNREKVQTEGMGVSAEVASEQATGVPGTNIGTQASLKKVRHAKITGTYTGEVVVACYYIPINGEVSQSDSQRSSLLKYLPLGRNPSSSTHVHSIRVGKEVLDLHLCPGQHIKGNMDRPMGGTPSEGSTEEDCTEGVDFYVGSSTAQEGVDFPESN